MKNKLISLKPGQQVSLGINKEGEKLVVERSKNGNVLHHKRVKNNSVFCFMSENYHIFKMEALKSY